MSSLHRADIIEIFDDYDFIDDPRPKLECHFCKNQLHEDNNAMTRCMDGKEPAALGFGWISVIVAPFKEVPCCDLCMEKPEVDAQIVMK